MTSQVWYTQDGEMDRKPQLMEQAIKQTTRRGPGRPRKGQTQMSTTQVTPSAGNASQKRAQKQVFDLDSFERTTLYKMYDAPAPVTSVEQALAAVGNDTNRLIEVINDGLQALAGEQVRASNDGWMVEDEEENLVPYTGSAANETLEKKLNAAVLAFAKLQGYSKELSRDKKSELKGAAQDFIRSNPKMIESIKAQQ